MQNAEIKDALENLGADWGEFKAASNKRLADAERTLESHHQRLELLAEGRSAPTTLGRGGDEAKWRIDIKSVLMSSDPSGGYLVPPEQSGHLIDAVRARAVLLGAGAQVFTTEAQTVNFPGVTSDPVATWRGEGETLTSEDPVYRQVKATPRKLQTFVKASNESLSDSRPEIAQILSRQMAEQLALGIDRAAFVGQATNTGAAPIPFRDVVGIQTCTALGDNGGVPANLDWLAQAIGLLLQANGRLDRAALFISARTYRTLLEIDEASGSNKPLLFTERTLDGGPLLRLMGVPTYVTSVLPDTLTQGSSSGNTSTAWLIDMSAVYVVIRSGTRIEIDRSRYFDTDSTAIRGTMRADVVLANPELAIEIPGFKVA